MYITGDIVNHIVITTMTYGYYTYGGDPIIRYTNVESLNCTSKTNTILCNYTLIFLNFIFQEYQLEKNSCFNNEL